MIIGQVGDIPLNIVRKLRGVQLTERLRER